MKMARQAGCRTENGFSMLLGQAAASFQIWTGLEMPLITDEIILPDVK
jgi:shikimate dehydrogenase